MRNTKAALYWIVNILRELHVPFHIAGGFAAKVYGANRELADIDLDIPEEDFPRLLPFVKEYVVYGPEQYKDESWDLLLTTLRYEEQDIDIAGAYQSKLFNVNTQKWESAVTDFSRDEIKEVFGIQVPVMNKQELIDYKSKLRREVDLLDLQTLVEA